MKMEGQTGHRKREVLNMFTINFVKIFYCLINIKVLHHTLKKTFLSYIHIPFNRQHCKG